MVSDGLFLLPALALLLDLAALYLALRFYQRMRLPGSAPAAEADRPADGPADRPTVAANRPAIAAYWQAYRPAWLLSAGVAVGLALLSAVLLAWSVTMLLPEAELTPFLAAAGLLVIASLLLLLSFYRLSLRLEASLSRLDALQSQVDLLAPAFEHHPGPLAVKDASLVYRLVNPAWAAWLGLPREQIEGQADAALLPAEQAEARLRSDQAALESGSFQEVEDKLRGPSSGTPAGTPGALEKRLALSRVRLERSGGLLVAGWDITRLSHALAELEAELADKERLLEMVDASLSHSKSELEQVDGQRRDLLQARESVEIDLVAARGSLQSLTAELAGARAALDSAGQAASLQDTRLAELQADRQALLSDLQELRGQHADLQRQLAETVFRSRLERLVAAISTHFINLPPDKVERGVQKALQSLGRYAGVDRCYLYLFDHENGSRQEESFIEWHAAGLAPRQESPARFSRLGFGSWMPEEVRARLNRLETVYLPHLNGDRQPSIPGSPVDESLRSLAIVPLVSERAVVGYLGLESVHAALDWGEETLNLLKIAAEMFVNTLASRWNAQETRTRLESSAHRLAELEQRTQESRWLADMNDLLQACRTADEAYPIIARSAARLIPLGSGALYLMRTAQDPAERVACWGECPPAEHELAANDCWGLRRGRPHLVTDPDAGPLCGHLTAPAPSVTLCVPLIAQGETVGLLHLRSDPPGPRHDPAAPALDSYQGVAVKIGEHIALALSNLNLRDRLRSQAIRDPLTGLFNRRYMEETLDRELRRAGRHATTVGVMMFDIDHMKPINDALGHDAGDALLKSLGGLLRRTFRGEDVACRYGGDEFTIILPEASLSDVWQRADSLREACKRLELEHDGRRIGPVTLSIGVGIYPDHGTGPDRLLQAADAAAYQSKSEGGDRVMIARTLDE